MTIKVFYRTEQSSNAATGYSPSAGKPAKVIADWLANPDIASHIQVEGFDHATDLDLCLAHEPSYVEGVLSCKIPNGFGNNSLEIANSLRYTTGSILAAAKHVLTSNDLIACSPTSGFHHAGYGFGGGFCTFNGLMVAAMRVHAMGLAKHILILDMDAHYGNGTQSIIRQHNIDYIDHITADNGYDTPDSAMKASDMVYRLFANEQKKHYDLVIFQAGADIHKDDPLSAGLLTTEQMRKRDANVFRGCVVSGTPCVWNLAGGYATDKAGTIEPVLSLHRQTIRECIKESRKQ